MRRLHGSSAPQRLRWTVAAFLALVVAAPLARGPDDAGAATVVDVPGSIDATGAQDVTDALNQFLAGVPDGATVRFGTGGRYRTEGVVFVENKRDVTLDGRGATLVAETSGADMPVARYNLRGRWPRSREHLEIRTSAGISVRDLTIDGPNQTGGYRVALEAQAGIAVVRSERVRLDRVTVRETYGDAVYVSGGSRGVAVADCTFTRIGRQGVAVVGGEDVTVDRCRIRDVARSVFDLEPGAGLARAVHLRDNDIGEYGNFLLAAVGARDGVGDVWLERNRVDGGRGVSVYVGVDRFLRQGIHLIDNEGTGRSAGYEGVLLRFERFDGIEVRGNTQAVADGVTPVLLLDSCNAAVRDNDFGGAGDAVRTEGDCSAPGLRPAPQRRVRPIGPGSAGARPGGSRRNPGRPSTTSSSSTSSTALPAVTATDDSDEGADPALLVVTFLTGLLAGGLAVGLWLRLRRAPAPVEPSDQLSVGGAEAERLDEQQ